MIVDSSALVAIARGEPGHGVLLEALRSASTRSMSAATFVELTGVLRDTDVRHVIDVIDGLGITIEGVDAKQAVIAANAYRTYGRGSGHAAHLDIGDTFSYALATATGQDLLFADPGFARTDVSAAVDAGPA